MGRLNPFKGATLANTLEHYHRIKSLYVKENEEDYSPDMENMDRILEGKPIRRHIKNHKRRELVYSKLFELTPSEKALIRDLENAGLLPKKKTKVSAHKAETKSVFKTEVRTTTKEVINPFTGKVMVLTEEEYRKYESINLK